MRCLCYGLPVRCFEICRQGHKLSVKVEGPWCRTILWEVPLMAIISETYFKVTSPEILSRQAIRERNRTKAQMMSNAGLTFVEFGTRRRFSVANHAHFLEDVLALGHHRMVGTSNVHFARIYGLAPVGTLAHEWIMFHAALTDYATANAAAGGTGVGISVGINVAGDNDTRAEIEDGVAHNLLLHCHKGRGGN